MAIIINEDLWHNPANDMIVVTTNGVVRNDGSLVMGRGAALEARERMHSRIERICGEAIRDCCPSHNGIYRYGFLRILEDFGIFQVKYRWTEPASLVLIMHSTAMLRGYLYDHPGTKVRMNFPGIGNGHLTKADALPLLERLPDSVTICYKDAT